MPDVFDIPEKITGQQCTAEEFNAIVEAARSVKIYLAILTQTGTGDPVATVLNADDFNYLGDIVWTRNNSNTGDYFGTLAGAFTDGKTIIPPFGNGDSGLLMPLSYDTKGYYQLSVQGGGDTVRLFTFSDLDYTPVEFSTIGGSIYVEIRVRQN